MRSWQVTGYGPPADVLELVEVEKPVASAHQVLVKVRGASLNFADFLMCRGEYQVRPEPPFTPGMELCGEVVAMGDGVAGLKVGDRIIGSAAMPYGGFAEYATMDAGVIFPAPEALTDAEAAVMCLSYQTAWFALHRRAQIQQGETLLVHAASGGVGSAAVQLGKAAGALVIAVVGNAEKATFAKALGADIVVDRSLEDFVKVVRDATNGRGADVIFDPVGGPAYKGSTKCVAFEGRIVVIGFASGEIPAPTLNHALVKNYSIHGLYWGAYNMADPADVARSHDQIAALIASGQITPVVGEQVNFENLPEALERLGAGATMGRSVLLPSATA